MTDLSTLFGGGTAVGGIVTVLGLEAYAKYGTRLDRHHPLKMTALLFVCGGSVVVWQRTVLPVHLVRRDARDIILYLCFAAVALTAAWWLRTPLRALLFPSNTPPTTGGAARRM